MVIVASEPVVMGSSEHEEAVVVVVGTTTTADDGRAGGGAIQLTPRAQAALQVGTVAAGRFGSPRGAIPVSSFPRGKEVGHGVGLEGSTAAGHNGYEREAGVPEGAGGRKGDGVGGGATNEHEPLLPSSLEKSWSFLSSSSTYDDGQSAVSGGGRSRWRWQSHYAGVATHGAGSGAESGSGGGSGSVSLIYCVSVVISGVIGSGIFASPGLALHDAGSVGAVLCLWVLGAFMSSCSYMISAELGTSFPDKLGDVRFLHEAFGDVASISYIWTVLVALSGAGLSVQAMIFAKYLLPDSMVGEKALAATCVVFFTAVAISGVALESKVQIAIGASRALLVGLMVAMAGTSLWRDGSVVSKNFLSGSFQGTKVKGLGLGLVDVLFAYTGGGIVVNLVPRMAKPNRDLPLALGLGMLGVMVAYLLLNLSYLCVLSGEEMATSLVVANDVASRVLGERASMVVGVLVAMSVAGNFQTVMRCQAEALQGASAVGKVPAWCGMGKKEPVAGLLFQCLSSVVLIALPWSNISDLLKFFGVLFTAFDLMKAIAAIKLRKDKPFHTRRVLRRYGGEDSWGRQGDGDGGRRTRGRREGEGGGGGEGVEGEELGESDGSILQCETTFYPLELGTRGGGGGGEGIEELKEFEKLGEEEEEDQSVTPFKMLFYPVEPIIMILLAAVVVITAGITQPKYVITSALVVMPPYPIYRMLRWIGWLSSS